MKKKKKQHFTFFKTLKEYWKIPRYRALIMLGCYFLFFAFIYIYVYIMKMAAISKPSLTVPKDSLAFFSTMDNYEYTYQIEVGDNEGISMHEVSGVRNQDVDNFRFENHLFYISNDIIYSSETKEIIDSFQLDLVKLRPDSLYSMLQYHNSFNKTEYKTGEIKKIYTVPIQNFNVAFLEELPPDTVDTIEIVMYEKNNQIYKIEINLLNLIRLIDDSVQKYVVLIEYQNINNISNIEEVN